MTGQEVLDISHYQPDKGAINWQQVKDDVAGVIIKTSQYTNITDPSWQSSYIGAGNVGLPRGAYHFCGITESNGSAILGDPKAEAAKFAAQYLTVGHWEIDPSYDLEISPATVSWFAAMQAEFRRLTGVTRDKLYAPEGFLAAGGRLALGSWLPESTGLWAARYNTTLGLSHPQLQLWQYTSGAATAGVTGSTDRSRPQNAWNATTDLIVNTGGGMSGGIGFPIEIDYESGKLGVPYEATGTGSQVINHAWFCALAAYGDLKITRMTVVNALGTVEKEFAGSGMTWKDNLPGSWALPDDGRLLTVEWDPAQTWDATAGRLKRVEDGGVRIYAYAPYTSK